MFGFTRVGELLRERVGETVGAGDAIGMDGVAGIVGRGEQGEFWGTKVQVAEICVLTLDDFTESGEL